jgi:AraC family transcriptional regulator
MPAGFRLQDPFIAAAATIFSLELGRAAHPAQEVVIESMTTALLAHLLRSYTNAAALSEELTGIDAAPAAVRRAISFVEDQPNLRVSLADMAGAAGLSRFHFSRLFRKHIGMSPSVYVEMSRIRRARAMIESGQLPLADIAYAVGFADQSHFTRRFRHYEGYTPAAYARDKARR